MEELCHSHAEPILCPAQPPRLYRTPTRRHFSFVPELKPIFHKLFSTSSEDDFAHGDMVVQRWYVVATNSGPMMDMPPTNKSVDVHGCSVFKILNGKIQQEWEYWDRAGFMKQLGMMPEQEASSAQGKNK